MSTSYGGPFNPDAYEEPVLAIPIADEFEAPSFKALVDGHTSVKFIRWPSEANSQYTFPYLTRVKFLDMKGISLPYLGPEICLCTELEVLDVRDNDLTYLPPELAELPKLKTILFTGNQLFVSTYVQLMNRLRQLDHPIEVSLPFIWSNQSHPLTLLSWNLTAQADAVQSNFNRTPARYLEWKSRVELILNVIYSLKPSIICFQEVEAEQLDTLNSRLRTMGYSCAPSFSSRPPIPGKPRIGVTTFYLTARIVVERTVTVSFSDLPATDKITRLQLLSSDSLFQVSVVRSHAHSFFLVNACVRPNRFEPKVILAEIAIIADRVDALSGQAVICGSLPFEPQSDPYQLLSTGKCTDEDFKLRRTYKDAYATQKDRFTLWEGDELKIHDYIWLSPQLVPTGTIETPTKGMAKEYFHTAPNSQWPSAHLPLGVEIDYRIILQEL